MASRLRAEADTLTDKQTKAEGDERSRRRRLAQTEEIVEGQGVAAAEFRLVQLQSASAPFLRLLCWQREGGALLPALASRCRRTTELDFVALSLSPPRSAHLRSRIQPRPSNRNRSRLQGARRIQSPPST